MKRRGLIALLGGAVAAWSLAARAQEGTVLGFLSSGSPKAYEEFLASFRRGLEVLGYTEGRNTVIESRWANGRSEELPALAEDLVRRKVHLIVTTGIGSALAAKSATAKIPLVFVSGDDPVRFGLVASFSRPGGNATGVNLQTSTLVGKRLDIVYELAPTGRIAFLTNPTNPEAATQLVDVQAAALLNMRRIVVVEASTVDGLESAFASLVEQGITTLTVSNDPLFNSLREQIVALALRHKVLTVYDRREYVVAGGLISYGVDYRAAYREMGIYAGKILRGAAPADLPILQPTKFELVINAKAAEAFGIGIPPTLAAQADEVIE